MTENIINCTPKNNYLLSIIIPHYRTPSLLVKLLDSIPVLTEIQVIVVDDNSNDAEYDRIIGDCRYGHVLFTKNTSENKGAGAARNIGLTLATGRWILFADADDYFLPGFYESVSKYFTTNYDLVFFIPDSIYIDTKKRADRHVPFKKYLIQYLVNPTLKNELLLKYRVVSPCSKLINASLITNNNIRFEEVIAANDVMFSIKTSFYSKSFMVDKNIIYMITRSKGTLTVNTDYNFFLIRFNAFLTSYKYLKENLDKKGFSYLNITGLYMLLKSRKYGISIFLNTFNILLTNRIKVINIFNYNPIVIYKRIHDAFTERKYLV